MAGPSYMPISFNATASSYIAHVRLPTTLMQKLEAEGASDMSISLSDGVLSVGGESFSLDAVSEEGYFDVVREHGSKMCSVGAVRDKIHIKQTLGGERRAQIKQRTEQAEREAHGRQMINVEAPPPAAKRAKVTSYKQVAKHHPQQQPQPPSHQQQRAKSAKPLSSSPPGGAMTARPPVASASRPAQGRAGSTGSLAELQRWCLHVLALGPLSLKSLEQQLQSAKQKEDVTHLAEARLLPRVLAQIAELQDSGRHHLLTRHLAEASPSWKGYTAEQRSTLRLLLERQGIEPAPDKGRAGGKPDSKAAQSGRGPSQAEGAAGEAEAAAEVVIRDDAAYREQKKSFDRKFREYKQLDAELGVITKTFEALEAKYAGASSEQQPRIAMELLKTYDEKKSELDAKTATYRLLHLELQSIKQAVTKFVEERNRR